MAKGKGKGKQDKAKTGPASSEPDPNLFLGVGEFTLPNGDNYAGEYCAHRYGLIWREGRGIYTTKDGQSYEGEWRDDKLVEEREVKIRFPTGEEYCGSTLQDKYAGAGTYTMENSMDISCEFADNKPKGNVMLIDINGRVWEGQAGENAALLLPENQFYFNIGDERGMGKLKTKYEKTEETGLVLEVEKSTEEVSLFDREREKAIFAKSARTLNDIDFAQSKWCQRYLRYRTMKDRISEKLKEEEKQGEEEKEEQVGEGAGSLTEEEKKWHKKFQRYKQGQKEKKKQKGLAQTRDSLADISLLAAFYSKEFKESCPPIKVFHPRCDWVENYLQDVEAAEEAAKEKEVEKIEQEIQEVTEDTKEMENVKNVKSKKK